MIKIGFLLITSYMCATSALPPCVCGRNYEPICGSDGHTYPNTCMLDCAAQTNADLKMTHFGDCDQPLNTCICTFEYKPVCGIDGTTYPNQCSLGCEKSRNPILEKKHDGPCKSAAMTDEVKVAEVPQLPACTCTRNMRPVCGTDGVTYNNQCLLDCAAQNKPLAKKADGPCDDLPIKVAEVPQLPACTCTRNMRPVCGTDGVTYNNQCLLDCAAQNKPLAKKADGPCDGLTAKVVEQETNSCVCTRNYRPVCGSDGTTYANPCVLGCRSNSEVGLRMVHDGPC